MPASPASPAGPAGSIWSIERVVFPSPVECPASEIKIPGLRQLKPTPPRPTYTGNSEASSPLGIYQTHSAFRDPAHAELANVKSWSPRDNLSKHLDSFDHKYFPKLDKNATFDQFGEIITSYSETTNDYPPMGRSNISLGKAEQMMQGDGDDMVLFGRWRHHKDAPLSLVKDMIEQELRGPGACSLYGPGGLKTSDHPLVCYYNERVEKLQQEEESALQASKLPLLSPVLMQGSSASQRSLLRSTTPVTFSMSKDGTFQTTGFHKRTDSMGSTVGSSSLTESSENETHKAPRLTRRDSGVHGLQPAAVKSSQTVPNRVGQPSLGNYEVLRYYTPDPALDVKGLDTPIIPPHRRKPCAMITKDYINAYCGGVITTVENLTATRNTRPSQQQRQYAQHARNTTAVRAPQMQRTQTQRVRNRSFERQAQLEHNTQGVSMKRSEQKERLQTARHQNVQQMARHAQPQQPQTTAQQKQPVEAKQPKRVSFDMSRNVSFVIPPPQNRRVTLVAPEDAEDAMYSDDDTVVDAKEVPNASKPTSPQSGSLSPQGRTVPRSILKTSKSGVVESSSSSVASAAAEETAGLGTSTEATPSQTTPGTTASSGSERQIKSPARAESIARKLNEHLKQIENQPTDENDDGLEKEQFYAEV